MSWHIAGKLVPPNGDVALGGCGIEVLFKQRRSSANGGPEASSRASEEENGGPEVHDSISAKATASSDDKGMFSIDLPDKQEITSTALRFEVSEPSGNMIGEKELNVRPLENTVEIPITEFERIVLDKPDVVAQPATRRIKGQVVERNSYPLPANLQLLLFVRKLDEEEREASSASQPVLATKADRQGYFSGEIPNEKISAASALISGVADEVAITLENSFIPCPVILAIDLPKNAVATKLNDCACDSQALTPRTPTYADIENAPDTYSVDLGTGQCVIQHAQSCHRGIRFS